MVCEVLHNVQAISDGGDVWQNYCAVSHEVCRVHIPSMREKTIVCEVKAAS